MVGNPVFTRTRKKFHAKQMFVPDESALTAYDLSHALNKLPGTNTDQAFLCGVLILNNADGLLY